MADNPRPHLFVVGADRSGTTLLRLMLNEHPRLSVGPETWFFQPLAARFDVSAQLSAAEVEEAVGLVLAHPRFREYPVTEAQFRQGVAALQRPTAGGVFAVLPGLIAAREGKGLFGDKTPGYSHCVPELARAFPEAKFVHIVRDARDVALSLIRVGWYGGQPWRSAQHWRERVGDCERARADLGPERMIRIDYPDLVLGTEEVLQRLCAFLGIEFHQAMLGFHERSQQTVLASEQTIHQKTTRPPSPSDVDVWKRDADRRLLLYVEGGAGRLMRRVGQEPALKGAWAGLARLAWCWALLRMHLLYPLRRHLLLLTRGEGEWEDPVEASLRQQMERAGSPGDGSEPAAGPMNGTT
ncbi:MAG: sulfotransferase family protein [Phycisphaerales bacterium JB038]